MNVRLTLVTISMISSTCLGVSSWWAFSICSSILPLILLPLPIFQKIKISLTPILFSLIIQASFLYGDISLLAYIVIKVTYYFCQFFFVMWVHFQDLNWDAFLINQSTHYLIVLSFSLAQHILMLLLGFKVSKWFFFIGLTIAIFGYALRILAFLTARTNFTHQVMTVKRQNHFLVTNGVYSLFKHPSYTGYYYFAIGSQIMMQNVVSLIGIHLGLVEFFKHRIIKEETILEEFFEEYRDYQKDKIVAIPFLGLQK